MRTHWLTESVYLKQPDVSLANTWCLGFTLPIVWQLETRDITLARQDLQQR